LETVDDLVVLVLGIRKGLLLLSLILRLDIYLLSL